MRFKGNILIMDPYCIPGMDVERLSKIYDRKAPKMRVRRTLDIEAATRNLERRRVYAERHEKKGSDREFCFMLRRNVAHSENYLRNLKKRPYTLVTDPLLPVHGLLEEFGVANCLAGSGISNDVPYVVWDAVSGKCIGNCCQRGCVWCVMDLNEAVGAFTSLDVSTLWLEDEAVVIPQFNGEVTMETLPSDAYPADSGLAGMVGVVTGKGTPAFEMIPVNKRRLKDEQRV
ncbi:MAG: hypothetical protein EOM68_19280 [Spirochaetia bacterium]|nr:hypothetical protein [Spirochaetia bacterium]